MEWRTIRGKFLAINAASMSCACPRSPKGLSPAAHLADGTTDLILVRKCSRFDFLRHLLRHTSKDDQVIIRRSASRLSFRWDLPFHAPLMPFLLLVRSSLTWTSSRSTECGVSASRLVTARVTRTWSWTYGRTANGKSSAKSVETTRLVDARPPTAAGTATAKSWPTRPSTSGTTAIGTLLTSCCRLLWATLSVFLLFPRVHCQLIKLFARGIEEPTVFEDLTNPCAI